jgi:hypothetical protein
MNAPTPKTEMSPPIKKQEYRHEASGKAI